MSKYSRNNMSDFSEITPALDPECTELPPTTIQIPLNPPIQTPSSQQEHDPYTPPINLESNRENDTNTSDKNMYDITTHTQQNNQQITETPRDIFTTQSFAGHPAPSIPPGTLPRPPPHHRVDQPTSQTSRYLDKGPCEGTSFKVDHRKPPVIPPSRTPLQLVRVQTPSNPT
jgi:hypothetical protein